MNHAGETYTLGGNPLTELSIIARGHNGHYTGQTLAIVGSHPATRELAPYDDPSVEIWLFNESAQKPSVYKRWDCLLQIHAEEVYTSLSNWVNKDHWNWLQQDHGNSMVTGKRKRIYMQEFDQRVPNCAVYPLKDILAMLPPADDGSNQFHYLRSSPAMALALAIYLGYERIMLYGSELSSNTEYTYQATNYAFWIGFAAGRGIDVQLKCWQGEFSQPIYGYEGELQLAQDYFVKRFDECKKIWSENDKAAKKIQSRLETALLELDHDKVGILADELKGAAFATGEAFGAMSEAGRYSNRTDQISRQEFERTSAKAQLQIEELQGKVAHEGGKVEYLWNTWKITGQYEAKKQLREFIRAMVQYALDAGTQIGVYRENIQYMVEYDKLLQAAGGVRALGKPEEYMKV